MQKKTLIQKITKKLPDMFMKTYLGDLYSEKRWYKNIKHRQRLFCIYKIVIKKNEYQIVSIKKHECF